MIGDGWVRWAQRGQRPDRWPDQMDRQLWAFPLGQEDLIRPVISVSRHLGLVSSSPVRPIDNAIHLSFVYPPKFSWAK